MNIKQVAFIFLLTIVCFKAAAQDIENISEKMSFPSNLPIPRFVIPLSDTLNGVSLRMDDLNSITSEKLNLVKHVEFVELCFNSQSDLNTLVGFLVNFKELKYLKFSDNSWAAKVSLTSIIIPNEVLKYKKVTAVSFSGKWQIDYAKSLAILQHLPNLRYFFFENIKQEFPRELEHFGNIKGLSIYNDNGLNFPNWIVKFSKLESISIGFSQYKVKGENSLNYSDVFRHLEKFPLLKSVYINYMYNLKGKYDDVYLKNLEKLKITSGKVENSTDFFKFLSNHQKLRVLALRGIAFDTLKKEAAKLKHLEQLIIVGQNTALVTDFSLKQLTKLKSLELSNFSQIPEDLEFPSGLVNLDLSDNRKGNLPQSISTLYELEALSLRYNSISLWPTNFNRLKKLTSLDLSGNEINQLPENISELKYLSQLNLQANPLKELPTSIGQLKNLKHLDLSYCDLKALPESFGKLQRLERLELESNFISSLPNSFSRLQSLKHLSLETNNLTRLPDGFSGLANLSYLGLSNNNIQKLPSTIGALKKLEYLGLAANKLQELPEELGSLIALQDIYLSNNTLTNQRSYDPREVYRKDDPKPNRLITANAFKALPKNLSDWHKLKTISMNNYTSLNEVDLFKSLFTISSKAFSVELENVNITALPLTGWANFNVKVLNLRNNKLTAVPADIIRAKYLESYNFNNNRLPSKPINLNSYAGNKYEKLLWFKEFGFIETTDLPKVDSMVLALLGKSNNHYYRKEFKQSVAYANQAISINRELALAKIFKTNLGEANYEVGNYKEAIEYLTQAIKKDTVGPVRIMNFITTDFEFRAKSYLKLGDTLKAIRDYEHLAKDFNENTWGDIGLLYKAINDSLNAKNAFASGIKNYQQEIEFGKKQKQDVELQQLSLLELYIVAEEFSASERYAENLKTEIKNAANQTLLTYLAACAKIGANKSKEIDFGALESSILTGKKSITRWGYDLFFKWLRVTKIEKDKEIAMRKLTDLIKPVY